MVNLPTDVRKVEDVISENPGLRDYAKFYNKKRFEELGFVVYSQPQTHKDVTIYGLWLIDKDSVADNLKGSNKNELVQDFIAYNRKDKSFKYYSGGRIINKLQQRRIYEFCETYGKDRQGNIKYYGCYKTEKGLATRDHRYRDENAENLPGEAWIRKVIKTGLVKARSR